VTQAGISCGLRIGGLSRSARCRGALKGIVGKMRRYLRLILLLRINYCRCPHELIWYFAHSLTLVHSNKTAPNASPSAPS